MKKYVLGVLIVLLVMSCDSEVKMKSFPFVFNYFNNTKINSYKYYKEGNEKQKLFINNKYIRDLEFKKITVLDSFNIKIPFEYVKDENYQKRGSIKLMDGNGHIIFFQLLVSTSANTFDFFNEVYQIAMEKKYPFYVYSAKYFKTKDRNFVVCDIKIEMEDEIKYVLGLDYTKDNNLYLDMSYNNSKKNKDIDRLIFSEIINSIKIDTVNIMPFYDDLTKNVNINIEKAKK